jgi:endo-1,4-beta-D-glucanase Y
MGTLARSGMLCAALLYASMSLAAARDCAIWPGWEKFRQLYLSEDGRIVDAGTAQSVTVSEGQAYALVFALIANDQASFAKILRWTGDNMAGGNLGQSLPAWQWGRAADGTWAVLDPNSASDADIWIAYALTEAAQLWHNAQYAQLARATSESILREEVSLVPGLGPTLLPGPRGFVTQQTWRLNASYSPLQALRAIARRNGNRLWAEVLESSSRVIVGSAPNGFAADWVGYRESAGFVADAATRGVGSYNAIRVYLWAGMLADADPHAGLLARRLQPMATLAAQHAPPESIDTQTLEIHGEAPPGFSAALLPLLARSKLTDTAQAHGKLIEAKALKDNQHYYSDVLALFGLGWLDGRYRFDQQGDLHVKWTAACQVG